MTVLVTAAAVFGATLPTLPGRGSDDRVLGMAGTEVLGAVCYPVLFLFSRAWIDYGRGWRRATLVTMAGLGMNTLLLVATLPLSVLAMIAVEGPWRSIAAGLLIALPSAACHGLVLVMAESVMSPHQEPPGLALCSMAAMMAAAAGLVGVMRFGAAWPSPVLALAFVLIVLPHLALMPVPAPLERRDTTGTPGTVTSSGDPRAP